MLKKLAVLKSDDPYLFPVELSKKTGLPGINENDVFQYLVAKHSELMPGFQMNAYKAIRNAEQYVTSGWVKEVFCIKLQSGITILSTRVHHSQAINKTFV